MTIRHDCVAKRIPRPGWSCRPGWDDRGINGTDYSMVMAGALMAVVPLIGVFIIGARQFIIDIAAGAMKF